MPTWQKVNKTPNSKKRNDRYFEEKQNESVCQVMEEFENVVKNTPSASKLARNNPSSSISKPEELAFVVQRTRSIAGPSSIRSIPMPSRLTLNVQAMSPNIKQVTVNECVDEEAEDNSPVSCTHDESILSANNKSFCRYAHSEDSIDLGRSEGSIIPDFKVKSNNKQLV